MREDLILDSLASLSRRIRAIEDQLDSLSRNTVRQAEEFENLKGAVDRANDDIATLDERTQPLVIKRGPIREECPCPMCK